MFSQWYPAPFELDGERYATAEHYMMAEKARLFGADDIRCQILQAGSPAQAKALGRKIIGFKTIFGTPTALILCAAPTTPNFRNTPI